MAHCDKDLLFKFFSRPMGPGPGARGPELGARGPGLGPVARAQATKKTQMGIRPGPRPRPGNVPGWTFVDKDLDGGIYPLIPRHDDSRGLQRLCVP